MAKKTKDSCLSIEERLEQALIPNWDEPYKLPNNWCWTHWGNCGQFVAGGAFKEKYQGQKGLPIPFYKVGSLKYSDRSGYLYDETNTIDEEIRSELKTAIIPVNSIIFAKIGEAIRLNRRSLNGVPCCIDNNLMAFIPNDKCYYKYVYYWSKGVDLYEYANATTVPAIRKTDLESISFPLAPYDSQLKIVERIESLFTKLDEAKEKAQEVVDGFETRKAAILHEAFSGELTAKWREENKKQYSDWKNSPLSQIATVVSGFAFSSGDFEPQNTVPCIKITNVGVGEYLPDEYEFLPEAFLKEYPRFIVNKGNILISLTRSYINAGLKVCISEETKPSLLNQRVAMIKNCNIRYIYYFLRSDKVLSYIKEKSKTTNQPNLSIKDLNNLIVPIACPEEQAEIVKLLDCFVAKEQQAKESAVAVIEQIDTMKKAILARAFRGELGTNDPNEESAVELLKQVLNTASEPKKTMKRTVIPKSLENRIKTDIERKIIKLYFQNEVDVLTVDLIMSVSSKKFDIMDALRSLQQRGILEKENDKYKFLG